MTISAKFYNVESGIKARLCGPCDSLNRWGSLMYSLHTTPSWTNFKMQKYSISNVISLGISRNTLKILEYLLFSSLYTHFILYHWRKRWKIPKKILLALWNFTEIGNNFTLSLLVMLVTNINVTMSVTSEKCLRHLINVGSECQICCRIGQWGGLRNHYWVSDEGFFQRCQQI